METLFKDSSLRKYNTTDVVDLFGYEVFGSVPIKQFCGDLCMIIGEPFSSLRFDMDRSLLSFGFVWIKVMGGYSDPDDFSLFLNGEPVHIEDFPNFFKKNIDKIKDVDNVFIIEIKEPGAFSYFSHIMVNSKKLPY